MAFFGGKGSDGLGNDLVVLVGCAVFGEQCAFGATQGWRETGSPAATTCFFVLPCGWVWRLRRDILLVAACLLWGDNAPSALHKVGGRQGRLRRLHVFCFAMRVGLAPSALHIVCGGIGIVVWQFKPWHCSSRGCPKCR